MSEWHRSTVASNGVKKKTITNHRHQVVDRFDSLRGSEQVHDEIAQVAAVVPGHQLHALSKVLSLDGDEGVAGKSEHDPAKADQVLLLVHSHGSQGIGGVGVICENVEDAAAVNQKTVFAQNQDL